MIGETIGEYRITALISDKGGFGIVYKAVHELLEQEVAVKVLKPKYTADPEFRKRFFTEAKTQARLKHPNIVTLLNFLERAGEYHLVVEYMEGALLPDGGRAATLADLLRSGLLPHDRLVTVFQQVLAGVGFAHEQGVIHRDIKPLNILFDARGTAKVADFGIARMLGGETSVSLSSGGRVGTPAYMSPEQVFDKRLTLATDIYSLGCTLYEAATGRLPFDETGTSSMLEAHVSEPPAPPKQVNPQLSEHIESAILRAMQKLPQDRFQSCGEFAAALAEGLTRQKSGLYAEVSGGQVARSAPSRIDSPMEPDRDQTRREPVPKEAAPDPGRLRARVACLADRIALTVVEELRSFRQADSIKEPGWIRRVAAFFRPPEQSQ
ncbi:MAG: serine/threonine protein kinase [Armatimonadetes bacterium]|nr:serine/threonine protein kinase [Armatimonadota bacterium]